MRARVSLRAALSAVLVGTAFVITIPREATAREFKCKGHTPTILGTRDDDVIHGTSGRDVIHARYGFDDVYGRGGNDIICGGDHEDELHGGRGDDLIFGGISGRGHEGPRMDYLYGGRGDDRLHGGEGFDDVFADPGDDVMDGDLLIFVDSPNALNVRWDSGVIKAWGRDTIGGSAYALVGSRLTDRLVGDESDNWLCSGGGDGDVVQGAGGNDRLAPGSWSCQYDTDIILKSGRSRSTTLYGQSGNDLISGERRSRLHGGTGNDRLFGESSTEKLFGGTGDDLIHAGRGPDKSFGGPGDDTMWSVGTYFDDPWESDERNGGDGNDVIHSEEGPDTINGGDGADRIFGGEGNDSALGGPGADRITLAAGDDAGFGHGANDYLRGGDGDDLLDGGGGREDIAVGEEGTDECQRAEYVKTCET